MNVRLRPFRVARGTDRTHALALLDLGASLHGSRSEVNERDGVAVGSADRDSHAVPRRRAGEGDNARAGSGHRLLGVAADVDSAVLPAGVRIVAEVERPEHRPRYRPAPAGRCGGGRQGDEGRDGCCSQSRQHGVQRRWTPMPLSNLVTVLSQSAPVERVSRDSGEAGNDLRRGAAAGPGRDELRDRV
jgi:hypothetical protein